jgi:type II secretory pathway pseudopilin PulG
MKLGFSLVELVLALLVLQIGVLAVAGMILLSQRNYRRAEMTLRGILEAKEAADSMLSEGTGTPGRSGTSWGELVWAPVSSPIQGLRVAAWSRVEQDTIAVIYAFPPVDSGWPDSLIAQVRE